MHFQSICINSQRLNLRINITHTSLLIVNNSMLLSRVRQGFVVVLRLFNKLQLWVSNIASPIFADDDNISASENIVEKLLSTSEQKRPAIE